MASTTATNAASTASIRVDSKDVKTETTTSKIPFPYDKELVASLMHMYGYGTEEWDACKCNPYGGTNGACIPCVIEPNLHWCCGGVDNHAMNCLYDENAHVLYESIPDLIDAGILPGDESDTASSTSPPPPSPAFAPATASAAPTLTLMKSETRKAGNSK